MADGSDDLDLEIKANKSMSKLKLVLVGLIFLLILVIAVGTTIYIMSDSKSTNAGVLGEEIAAEVDKADAIYHRIRPPFVINFHAKGRIRYIQITVELMARSDKAIKMARKNMPLIKNNLVTLFSSADFESLKSYDGKEKLRKAALEEVQSTMVQETGEQRIEAVLFTGFVIQ